MRLKHLLIFIFAPVAIAHYGDLSADSEPGLSTVAVKAAERLLMDIKQVKGERLIAVGERGHILLSDDRGQSWQQKQVPTEALLTKLFFIDENTGWAVGHEQTILKTTSAGDSWELLHSADNLDQPALFEIWFRDESYGIAIGSYGLYLSTNDGGESWEEVYQATLEDEEIGFPHFYSLAMDEKSGHLFMAGELGFLAKSEDDGESWQKLDSPYDGSFFNIMTLSNGNVLAMGLRGHLFLSKDSGLSWSETDTQTISVLQESLLLPDGRILIVGADGTQLISEDKGETVTLIQRSDRVHLASAVPLTEKEILLVGINGVLKTQLK